jgi:hypothetical protein
MDKSIHLGFVFWTAGGTLSLPKRIKRDFNYVDYEYRAVGRTAELCGQGVKMPAQEPAGRQARDAPV